MLSTSGASSGSAGSDPYFKNVSLLLHGDGTNGSQNNTFVDSSPNNLAITRNGNPNQGSFSPYGDRWSNYFDGVGDYLEVADNAALDLSGDFTIEVWVYWTKRSGATFTRIFTKGDFQLAANVWLWGIDEATGNSSFNFGNPNANVFTGTLTPNVWTHLAVSRSGTSLRGFKDGVLAQTVTTSQDFTSTYTVRLGAGSSATSNELFCGWISNARIVKGTALYTGGFTPPTSQLTAITNTSLLTCHSNRFVDGSVNNFTITRVGDVSVERFSPFIPTTDYSSSNIGGSSYLDGTGDYFTIPSNAAFAYGTGDFTIECWAYLRGLPATSARFNFYDGRGATNTNVAPAIALFNNAGSYFLQFESGGTQLFNVAITPYINQWYHFALCRSGTTIRIFMNGVQMGSATNTTNYSSAFLQYVGSYSSTVSLVVGYMSDVRVLKGTGLYTANFTPPTSPLTAIVNTSLLLGFTNSSVIDNTAVSNIETVGNAQISTTIKKYGSGSVYFDGTGDYLQMLYTRLLDLVTADFTFEAWVYPTVANTVGTRIFSTGGGTVAWNSTNGIHVLIQTGNGTASGGFLAVQLSTNTASPVAVANSTVVPINQWTFITVCVQGTTAYVGVNGEVNSGSVATRARPSTNPIATIGTIPGESNASIYKGYMDEIRLTFGIARYTANFTPPTAPFPNK